MDLRIRNITLPPREQKKQRLLKLKMKSLQTRRKKNSNHRKTGKVFWDEVEKLNKIYSTSRESFESVVNLQIELITKKKKKAMNLQR